MNSTQVTHVTAHVAAVTKLLLGNKMMQPGMMILSGEPLDASGRIEVARMARQSQKDVIHIEFSADGDDLPLMGGINLFLPRDSICYTWSGCRLSLVPGRPLALIAQRNEVRSCFKALPGEILQLGSRPAGLAAGIERATARIAALVRDGVDVTGQVVMREYVDA